VACEVITLCAQWHGKFGGPLSVPLLSEESEPNRAGKCVPIDQRAPRRRQSASGTHLLRSTAENRSALSGYEANLPADLNFCHAIVKTVGRVELRHDNDASGLVDVAKPLVYHHGS